MENKLIAVIKRPYEKPETISIDKGLESLQKIVEGDITAAYLPDMDDVFGFCNDDGLNIGMEPNFYRPNGKTPLWDLRFFSAQATTEIV